MQNKTHNIVSATIADMVEYQQEMDSRQVRVRVRVGLGLGLGIRLGLGLGLEECLILLIVHPKHLSPARAVKHEDETDVIITTHLGYGYGYSILTLP